MSDTGLPEDPNGAAPAEGEPPTSPVPPAPPVWGPAGAPPPPPAEALPEGATTWGWEPAPPARQKPLWGWFALGFFGSYVASGVLSAGMGFVLNAIDMSGTAFVPALSALGLLPTVLIFTLSLVLFLTGRKRGDNRLRSLGLGALISYAVGLLIALLAFGSCLIVLNGSGGM